METFGHPLFIRRNENKYRESINSSYSYRLDLRNFVYCIRNIEPRKGKCPENKIIEKLSVLRRKSGVIHTEDTLKDKTI